MTVKHDDIGRETLNRMSAVDAYNRWIIGEIMPWLGETVLEVGSGIGNMSQFFTVAKRLILTDIRDEYLDTLAERFRDHPAVTCEHYDLEGSAAHLRNRGVDTVIALNVLEHIRDDGHALGEIASLLVPGGRVILQLPAHPLLYGSLDINLDHFRRYTISGIRTKFKAAGLEPEKCWRFNMFGAFGWFLSSRVLRREILPTGQLSLFNRLTPAFVALERVLPVPFGLSIMAIGVKRG